MHKNLPIKNEAINNKKKFDFNLYKTNTVHSLNEVEQFLKSLKSFSNYIKLYKILK